MSGAAITLPRPARLACDAGMSPAVIPALLAPRLRRVLGASVALAVLSVVGRVAGAEIAEVQRALLEGSHAIVIKQATAELRDGAGNSEWSMLLARALLQTGKLAEADAVLK